MIQKEEMPGFNKRFDVVSAFIVCGGKILMLHRQDHKPQGNTWSMPAGKVEPGDGGLAQALSREIREELDVDVEPGRFEYFDSYYVRHDGYDFEYHVFRLDVTEPLQVKLGEGEHKAHAWMSPEDALALGPGLMPDEDRCIRDCFGL